METVSIVESNWGGGNSSPVENPVRL